MTPTAFLELLWQNKPEDQYVLLWTRQDKSSYWFRSVEAAGQFAAAVTGVLPEPAPVCLCDPGVLPTHLQFKLVVNVACRGEQGAVLSEIRLRLLDRFRAERVPLPNPEVVHANRS